MTVRNRHLAVAAVLVFAGAAALAVSAWWLLGDGDRSTFWAVAAVRGIVALAVGKAGLKVALAVVLAAVALVAWLRGRAPRTAAATPAGAPADG